DPHWTAPFRRQGLSRKCRQDWSFPGPGAGADGPGRACSRPPRARGAGQPWAFPPRAVCGPGTPVRRRGRGPGGASPGFPRRPPVARPGPVSARLRDAAFPLPGGPAMNKLKVLVALVALLGCVSLLGVRGDEPRKAAPNEDKKVAELMQGKLKHSQKVLE